MLILATMIFAAAQATTIDPAHLPPKGVTVRQTPDGKQAWLIRGNDMVIDLEGRSLKGNATDAATQDGYTGIGILLDGCHNVTLKNVQVSGFRHNIVMSACKAVKLLGCDIRGSRAIRMGSAGKPVDTFLNLRDVKVWKDYGAGLWMEKCQGCTVEHNLAEGSQNGILMVECSACTLLDNHCSYNSGWGFGLWNCSRNTLAWNHADFCNRPWAGGWGGDAAGMAVAGGCFSNQFIANSLTHGGDGFFLTDSVNGGFDKSSQTYKIVGASSFNFIAHNDGSWSSNNAFEGTFSQSNVYFANQANDSNYGFWLGFSSFSFLLQNEIMRDRTEGVAIGQGSSNTLFHNDIEDIGGAGVHVWSDPGPVEFDQPSTDNRILQNRIARCRLAISATLSSKLAFSGNTVVEAQVPADVSTGVVPYSQSILLSNWTLSREAQRIDGWMKLRPAGWKYYREGAGAKGPDAIRVGDFAPQRS